MSRIKKDDGALIIVHHNLKGAINEHIATAWLMKEGFDVFRNVSPRGRADIVIRDWTANTWTSVDVKSEQFDLRGTSPMAAGQRATAKGYEGSDIRYLVVRDDGTCSWYEDLDHPLPGAVLNGEDHWVCPKSGHRHLHPSHEYTRREWSFFAYWAIEYQGEFLTQVQIDVCWAVKRPSAYKHSVLTERELKVMRKILVESHARVTGVVTAANDNSLALESEAA